MSDLHDARVEAARVAYEYTNAFGPERETRMRAALAAADAVVTVDAREHLHAKCDCVPDLGPAHCHLCSNERGAPVPWPECSAVATGVTVEMIAKVLADHSYGYSISGLPLGCECGHDQGEYRHEAHQAAYVLALIRGGEERCRDCSRPAPARDMLCRNCLAKSEVGG